MSAKEQETTDHSDNDKESTESSSMESFEKVDADSDMKEKNEQNIAFEISDIMEPTELEVQQAEDPFLKPISEEQKQFYGEESTNRAVNTLILFSLMMFSMPFIVMAFAYYYIFKDHFHLPTDQAMLYAGLCGVLCVFVIIFWFIKIAYDEEKEAERSLKAQNKEK